MGEDPVSRPGLTTRSSRDRGPDLFAKTPLERCEQKSKTCLTEGVAARSGDPGFGRFHARLRQVLDDFCSVWRQNRGAAAERLLYGSVWVAAKAGAVGADWPAQRSSSMVRLQVRSGKLQVRRSSAAIRAECSSPPSGHLWWLRAGDRHAIATGDQPFFVSQRTQLESLSSG